jgi:phosphatidylglycerophosphate synthase
LPVAIVLACGILYLLALVRPFDGPIGWATRLTLLRLLLVLGLGVGAVMGLGPSLALTAICVVEMILDGLDGPLARRRGEASGFGSRLDGETDALFVLVLSLLAWRRPDGPGVVVLGIGAMRYAMATASFLWPRLRGQVPSSLRAKIICDSAIVALLLILLPVPGLASSWRDGLAWLAFAMLVYSFSFDVRYLLENSARERA